MTVLVDHAEAVRVPIRREADGGASVDDRCHEAGQVAGDRLRRGHAGKGRVTLGAQLQNARCAAADQAREDAGAGGMHGVEGHAQAGAPDTLQVDVAADVGVVGRARVDAFDDAIG